VQLYQDGQLSKATALSRLKKQVPGISDADAARMLTEPSGMLQYQPGEAPQEGGYGGPGGKKGGPPPINANFRVRARGNPIDELGLFFGAGDVVKIGMEGGTKKGVEKRIQGIGRTEDGRYQIFFTDGTLMISRQENGNDLWTRITRYDGRKNMLGKVGMPVEGQPGEFLSEAFIGTVKGKKEFEVLFKNGKYVGYPKGAVQYAGPGSRPDGTPPPAPPGTGGNNNPGSIYRFNFNQGNPFLQITSPAAPDFATTEGANPTTRGTPPPDPEDVIFEPREGYHWDGTFDNMGRPRYVRDSQNMQAASMATTPQTGQMPPGGMPLGNQVGTMPGGQDQMDRGMATVPVMGMEAMTMQERGQQQMQQQRQQMAQQQQSPFGMNLAGQNTNAGSSGTGALDPMLYITPGNQSVRGQTIGGRKFGDTTSTANKGDPDDTKSGTQGYLSAEAGGDIVSLPGVGQVALDYLAGKINYREMYDRLNRLTGEPRSNRALGEFTRREGRLPLPFGASIAFLQSQGRAIPQGGGRFPLNTSKPGSKNDPRTSTGNVNMSGNIQNRYNPGGGGGNMAQMGNMNQQMNMAGGNEQYGGNPPPVAGYGTARRGMPEGFFNGLEKGDLVVLNAMGGVSLVENGAYAADRTNGYGRGYVKPSLNKNGVLKRVQGYGFSPGGVAQIFFTDGTIAQDRQDRRGGSNLKASLMPTSGSGASGPMTGGTMNGNVTTTTGTADTSQVPGFPGMAFDLSRSSAAPVAGWEFNNATRMYHPLIVKSATGSGQDATGFGRFGGLLAPTLEDIFGAGIARTAELSNFLTRQQQPQGQVPGMSGSFREFLETQGTSLLPAAFTLADVLNPNPPNTFADFINNNVQQQLGRGFGTDNINNIFGGLGAASNMLKAGPLAANLSDTQRAAISNLSSQPLQQFELALQPSMWSMPTRFRDPFETLAGQRFNSVLASQGTDPKFQFLPFFMDRGGSFF
jgi:hypothetical protein